MEAPALHRSMLASSQCDTLTGRTALQTELAKTSSSLAARKKARLELPSTGDAE